MKTAIKLILIYLVMQLLSAALLLAFSYIYVWATGADLDAVNSMTVAPSLLLAIAMMTVYLWRSGYISKEKVTWSVVSPRYMALTTVITLSSIWLLDVLLAHLALPDLMKATFDLLQSGWLGIATIAIIAPILEELLFRGAITKVLLQRYNPTKAIVVSGLIFGLFHINPIQVVGASLIGLLLAWVYYKTASLIPCIVIHIINNSLSVYFSLKYPEVDTIEQLVADKTAYVAFTVIALALFFAAFLLMKRTTIAYPWKRDLSTNETITIEQ